MLWFLLYLLLRRKVGNVGLKYKTLNKKLMAILFRYKARKELN